MVRSITIWTPVWKVIWTLFLMIVLSFNQVSYADQNFMNRHDVQDFIKMMVKKHKFKKQYLIILFSKIKIRPQIVKHFNKPLEKQPWHYYQMIFVNPWHIQHGVEFWNKYATSLAKAEKIFGVPASIIVATIGIETRYGQRTGEYRVIDSLANLAFTHSSRAFFFRNELEEFLILTREEHLNPLTIMGSYAGAIGQPQFMPSSYRYYSVNFSKSGKTDLMHNEVDVIGSIANYYQKHGWTPHAPIAVSATILGDRYHYLLRNNKINQPLTMAEAVRLGVIPKSRIGEDNMQVKVVELRSHYSKEYWIGFHNFDVIKRYNASDLYAMAVYQLSNYISERRNK